MTVELKSGRSLRGILDESDSFMNIVLRKEARAPVDASGAHPSSDALVNDSQVLRKSLDARGFFCGTGKPFYRA